VFGFVKRNYPERSGGRVLLAEKGVRGKGRQPLSPLSAEETSTTLAYILDSHLFMLKQLAVGVGLLAAFGLCGAAQSRKADTFDPQTVAYCKVLKDPQLYNDKMIRVRALYQTDFEQSAITAPDCTGPVLVTWVDFEKSWESRTTWRLRHAINSVKWRVQTDVVFIGRFKARGSYGHQGMYPFSIEVYQVEAVKPSGSFRSLPTGKKAASIDASGSPAL
jgi:hypothetical protein